MSDDISIDLTNFHDITGGDTSLEKQLFDEFIRSSDQCIDALEVHCGDGSNDLWKRNAHGLKSISINLGAEKLSALALSAQNSFEAPPAIKQSILDEIKSEYQKVRNFLLAL